MKLVTYLLLVVTLILTSCREQPTNSAMSAVPTPYTPSFSFYDWNVMNPNVPAPGQKWDIEYNNIKTLFDAMLARAALIQRDDGRLANASVGREQLSADFASGVDAPLPWAEFTDYALNSSVMVDGSWYWALEAHNSGENFDPSKWQFVGTFFSGDPLSIAITTTSLTDGVLSNNSQGRAKMADGYLSADAEGRAKMADGYVTQAKLSSDTLTAKGVVLFDGNYSGIAGMTFANSGVNILATPPSTSGISTGDSITFAGETGNNTVLNGTWRVTNNNGTSIAFTIDTAPAGALAGGSTAILTKIYLANGIIDRVAPIFSTGNFYGSYQVFFKTSQATAYYVVNCSASEAFAPLSASRATIEAFPTNYLTTSVEVRVNRRPSNGVINSTFISPRVNVAIF